MWTTALGASVVFLRRDPGQMTLDVMPGFTTMMILDVALG